MRRTSTTFALCGVSVLVALVSPVVAGAHPAADLGGPERSGPAVLDVTSVSPWVTARGTFRVSFGTARLPPDSIVTTTIHQRLSAEDATLREAAESQMDREAVPRNLQAPVTTPLAELAGGNGSATVQIAVRPASGDPDPERQLLPTPGIHPVTIEVTPPEGDPAAVATVFLNRLPEEDPVGRDGLPATASVQLLAALDSGPALGVNGRTDLSTEESLAVSAWEAMLTENLDLPLTVALRPNTLLGLQRDDEPARDPLVDDLAGSAFVVAAQSYVKVDAAALVATGSEAFDSQLRSGGSILTSLTGQEPAGIWMFDDTVDTEAANRLLADGVGHLFVSEDRLALGPEVRDRARPTLKKNRTLALAGAPGMTVSSYDADLTRLLLEVDLPPGLRAHRGATALMASWFDAVREGPDAFPGVSSAVVLSPGTDQELLSEFVSALSEPGPLAVSGPTVPSVDRSGDPFVARLRQRDVESANGVVDRWRATAERIGGFASMTSPGDPTAAEWGLVNDQTLAIATDAGARSTMWEAIEADIDERLAMIQTPPPRSVVLTSRSGSIPVRIRNRGDLPVTVRMATRSPRLEFPSGATRDILLRPGENRIDVPVEVQAPGSSLLRLDLASPDGVLDIREVQVTVRSSSISGVGAVLSVISLCVLALWWIRTFLKRRSDDAQQAHPTAGSTSSGTEPPGTEP